MKIFQSLTNVRQESTDCEIFLTISQTLFFIQEEVILEAAKMENWRPVNVSFWHKPQPPSGATKLYKGYPNSVA